MLDGDIAILSGPVNASCGAIRYVTFDRVFESVFLLTKEAKGLSVLILR